MKILGESEILCALHGGEPQRDCAQCNWLRSVELRLSKLRVERNALAKELEQRLSERTLVVAALR